MKATRSIPRRRAGLALLAATVLALTAAACGGSATGGDGNGGGSDATATDAATNVANVTTPIDGTADDLIDIADVCGDKEMTIALADGFGGNSWRRITRAEFEAEAKKCPSITKTLYTDAQGDTQKAIADINSLVAQGADAIITFPDAAEALLPAIKKATQAGVVVVTYVSQVGGKPGVDYTAQVGEDVVAEGETYAEWMLKALHGKGNIIFLGGQPGNTYSEQIFEGIKNVVAKNPDLKLLENDVVDTNWDPAQTQKVVAGLLTKHHDIDGIISDYGGGSVGGIRAFVAAKRPLVPWAANDANEFACMWQKYSKTEPGFQIATVTSRNWMSRVALRRAVAALQGKPDPEPTNITLPLFEDSIAGGDMAPKCDESLPPDAILSSQLTPDELKNLFSK